MKKVILALFIAIICIGCEKKSEPTKSEPTKPEVICKDGKCYIKH